MFPVDKITEEWLKIRERKLAKVNIPIREEVVRITECLLFDVHLSRKEGELTNV